MSHVLITLNRPEICQDCGERMQADDKAFYELGSHLNGGRKVYCEDCGKEYLDA